ncbi:MAG: nucleotidyltransferase family protein [Acidobacteriota bacterium]
MRPSPANTPRTIRARGALLARALAGSWRRELPPFDLDTSEFADVLPLAVSSGVGGLAWRRVRGTSLAEVPGADQLLQASRHYAIQNAVHTLKLATAFSLFRGAGIEPVLAKGWSLSALYPEPGMRPWGDIDLCVRPEQFQAASDLLEQPANSQLDVDLHFGFGKFYDDRTDELFERSQIVKLDGTDIRVLQFEDHLRFLCLHLLRHGANRSMWLCDIAAALEGMPADFDWELAIGSQQPQAEWVTGAIQVTRELLNVQAPLDPISKNGQGPPKWLGETILNEWGTPYEFPDQVKNLIRKPLALIKELPRHWPNAIEATINLRGRFSDWPRFPYQLGEVLVKTARLLRHVGGAAK